MQSSNPDRTAAYASAGVIALILTKACVGQAMFMGLGDLPGGDFTSRARAVSHDGLVVVGVSHSANGTTGTQGCCEAFKWTLAGGMVALGDLPGASFESEARGVNADGSLIVGDGHTGFDFAVTWTGAPVPVAIPELPGGGVGGAVAHAVSAGTDPGAGGWTIVGSDIAANGREAFVAKYDGGAVTNIVGIGDLPGGVFDSIAYGVSKDGNVVVGVGKTTVGSVAFRFTQQTGMMPLGDLPGGVESSTAWAVSGDGSTIVGEGAATNGRRAFRWTQAGGMEMLGEFSPSDFWGAALGANDDGSVIVGRVQIGSDNFAFIWTQGGGLRSLQDELVNVNGLNLAGWTLRVATSVSGDGKTIVGYGTNPQGVTEAFIAVLEAACYADCDESGTLDFFDFLCFQSEFATGGSYADCDGNLVLDLFDFLCYQNAFVVGCP